MAAMSLVTGGRSRERILVYGMEFVGKSYCALDIAARIAPHRLFVIDNDNAWDRMLEEPALDGTELVVQAEWRWNQQADRGKGGWEFDGTWANEGGNVWVYHVQGWEQNVAAIQSVTEEATPHDWCLIDSGTALWSDVSDYFVDQVFGKSKSDYFLQARIAMEAAKNDKDGPILDGWKDYGIINPLYNDGVMKFLITPPCHLLVTTEEEQVKAIPQKGVDIEGKETRNLYGQVGYKPRGQKRIGHNMQTVIRLERKANGDFCARTIKDRGGRERWSGEVVTGRGFAEWYLEETAGWQEESAAPTSTSAAPAAKSPAPAPKGNTTTGFSESPKPPPSAPKPKMAAKG